MDKHWILLVDPQPEGYLKELEASLRGCKIIVETSTVKAREFIFYNDVDLIVLDHGGDPPSTEALQFFKSAKPSIPVIIITPCGSERLAVEVFRCGASDYFTKPLVMEELWIGVRTALGLKSISDSKESGRYMNGLHRALRYINRYYHTKIRLSQVAREAGMSVSCFERSFKDMVGVTFTTYVSELRIIRAIELLKEKNLPMSNIAFACGFTNQFHFTRTFKKVARVPPTVFRKSLLEDIPLNEDSLPIFRHLKKQNISKRREHKTRTPLK